MCLASQSIESNFAIVASPDSSEQAVNESQTEEVELARSGEFPDIFLETFLH